MAHQARFDPDFLSIKHLEVLLFPLDGMLVHSKVTPPAFDQAFLIICSYPFVPLGPVVGSPISANPALKFNPGFFVPTYMYVQKPFSDNFFFPF